MYILYGQAEQSNKHIIVDLVKVLDLGFSLFLSFINFNNASNPAIRSNIYYTLMMILITLTII